MSTAGQTMAVLRPQYILGILTVSWTLQAQAAQSIGFTKETFPDPRLQFEACGRDRESWVCDPGGYLSPQQADNLDRRINTLSGIGSRNAVLVGVVPKVLQNGVSSTNPAVLRAFTNYLQQSAWGDYASNVLVLIYHVSGKEVWVQADSSSDAAGCICQLTYESQQYIKDGLNTVLDIFISKFVDVFSGQDECRPQSDGVPWRVDASGACTWDKEIVIDSVKPLTGLPEGGTQLVIMGRSLDLTEGPVLVGNLECALISREATRIVCVTAAVPPGADINAPRQVSLLLSGGQVKYDTGQRFVYVRPTLTSARPLTTTISGGLLLTVQGKNLDLAESAVMVTTLTGTNTGKQNVYTTDCEVQSAEEMVCPNPELDLSTILTRRRKRYLDMTQDLTMSHGTLRDMPRHHRRARAAVQGEPSKRVGDVNVTAVLHVNNEQLPLIGIEGEPVMILLTVYENPHLFSFEDERRTKEFVSVWPRSERSIEIKGTGLLPALEGHQLKIQIGTGVCRQEDIHSNLIVCSPPIRQPQVQANQTHPEVQAYVGSLRFDIGYLEYFDTLWKYAPMRYTLLGIGAGILVLSSIVVGCCVGCYLRTKPNPYEN